MIIAFAGAFVGAFILQWYNYVLFQVHPFNYWMAYGFAFVVIFVQLRESMTSRLMKFIMSLCFLGATIGQILAWGGAITLPLFSVFAK